MGRGLGRSHALFYGRRGAKVVVNDLGGSAKGDGKSASAADKVVDEIKAAGGTAVANYDSVENGAAIIKTAIDSFGRIDILINNAGILRDVSFAKMTPADWDIIFRVHVNGAFSCTHAAWPYMRDQGYGRIIFTASAAGIYGNFGQANYSAAKLALVGFGNTLAIEGAKKNVLVNTIAPVAASRMTEGILPPEAMENLKPEYVTPLVGWLTHERCEENSGLFEVGGGFFGKLRWERAEGKFFPVGREIAAEAVQAAFKTVTDFSKSTHPANITDSLGPVFENLSKGPSKGGNEFIDVDQALGWKFPEIQTQYDERDLALYALAVGAAKNPTDVKDLHLVYERNGDGFYSLPSYGVQPALNAVFKFAEQGITPPGMNYGFDRILHGEQYLELVRPLPAKATLRHQAHVEGIFDKGKHALVVTHFDSYDAATGELLIKNDMSTVVRGAGGWGGERGPSADVNVAPDRAPDFTITEKTDQNQALLYRLLGDWNPLHVDPEFATMFGFEKPILHGLCTFGFVTRAAINSMAKGDPRTFKSIRVRFADSVFPGETLKIELWKENDLRVIARATVVERNKVVISNAAVEFFPEIPTAKAKPAVAAAPAPVAASVEVSTPAIFEAIKAHVAKTPDLKKINTVYQFNISSPDSAWVLDLKSGEVKAGTVAKADCTLALSDADWIAMATGKADPMKLFQSGKLKITGNVMASQKLNFLQQIDKSAAPSASPAPPAAAPSGGINTPAVFEAIGAYVAKTDELKKINTVYQFNISSPASAWVLDLKKGEVKAGTVDKADCTLALSDADWLDMVAGKADPMKLFQSGKLKITGNVMASQKLNFLQKIDKAAAASSVAAKPVAAPAAPAGASVIAPRIFAALQERLTKNPGLAKEVNAVISFKVKDAGFEFTADLASGTPSVKPGLDAKANTRLTLTDDALAALAKGEDARSLYQHGALRVDGELLAAHHLSFLKSLV